MRIALFFLAFTLGVGVAAGLDAADAASRHRQDERNAATVVVPRSAVHEELQVQPISYEGPVGVGNDGAVARRGSEGSGWVPGAGEVVIGLVAVSTIGAGLFVRRRVLLPI
jgi:hypothetical protein